MFVRTIARSASFRAKPRTETEERPRPPWLRQFPPPIAGVFSLVPIRYWLGRPRPACPIAHPGYEGAAAERISSSVRKPLSDSILRVLRPSVLVRIWGQLCLKRTRKGEPSRSL